MLRFTALLSMALLTSSFAACSDDTGTDPDGSTPDASGDGSRPDARGDAALPEASTDAGSDASGDGSTTPTGPMVDRTDPQLYDFELDPEVLDPTVADSIEPQYALLDSRVAPLGKLVVFLTGAANVPGGWRDHGRQVAGYGFHVLIPHYNNRWSSGTDPCEGMGGSCSEDVRWEALTGEDVTSAIDIPRADSAEGRVLVMLEHLVTEHPGGDWGYYLNADGSLRQEHVIIAGISHGAASTGLFASRRAFHRAVMHSGGYWSVADPPATPIAAFYGLSHTDDEQHMGHLDAWESSGMLGSPTSIDGASAPFGDARQLITSEANSYPHCSVAVHSSSPTDAGGAYLFDAAWRYMYGAPAL
jgi:hypothetical protein